MKSPEEQLNEQLEHLLSGDKLSNGQQASNSIVPGSEFDPMLEPLIDQARRLQHSPQLKASPEFARRLERRLLRRQVELSLQRKSRRWSLFAFFLARPALNIILGSCLLFCLLGSSILVFAARVSDPTNPFYGITRWEQHFRVSLAHNPADQASLLLLFAREQLNALSSPTTVTHADTYQQALADLDQHTNAAATAINQLPAGTQRNRLLGELARLKLDTIHVLHDLLPQLALAECMMTTSELAHLGDTVLRLTFANILLPAHPNGRASIRFSGTGIESGAQLLVDDKVTIASRTSHNGQMIFVVDWKGYYHPHSLGILNPDGTAAQTTTINIQQPDTKNTPGGNQNGNGHRPTPTPRGDGNDKGNKPDGPPSPHDNKPDVTPTPSHEK